ncbi:MAG TPA: DUF2231 domain-containing protein [Microlunatus sp.]
MEILGLPLHPLIIHAVVVLVPLAALGGIAISVLTWARKRYGSLVVVGAFGAAVTTYVAQVAGQYLYNTKQQRSAALEAHAAIGGQLLLWVILLFVGTVVVMLAQRLIDLDQPRGRIALISGAVITIAMAVVSTVQVMRIGHAGAVAVWG